MVLIRGNRFRFCYFFLAVKVIQVPLMNNVNLQLILIIVFVQIHGYHPCEIVTQFYVVFLVEVVAELEGIVFLSGCEVFTLERLLKGHQALVIGLICQ